MPEEFENSTITGGQFGFVVEENSGSVESRMIILMSSYDRIRKARSSKYFPSALKCKASVFKFLRLEVRFRKAPFSRRIIVNGRPIRRNKAAFSNSPGCAIVWDWA